MPISHSENYFLNKDIKIFLNSKKNEDKAVFLPILKTLYTYYEYDLKLNLQYLTKVSHDHFVLLNFIDESIKDPNFSLAELVGEQGQNLVYVKQWQSKGTFQEFRDFFGSYLFKKIFFQEKVDIEIQGIRKICRKIFDIYPIENRKIVSSILQSIIKTIYSDLKESPKANIINIFEFIKIFSEINLPLSSCYLNLAAGIDKLFLLKLDVGDSLKYLSSLKADINTAMKLIERQQPNNQKEILDLVSKKPILLKNLKTNQIKQPLELVKQLSFLYDKLDNKKANSWLNLGDVLGKVDQQEKFITDLLSLSKKTDIQPIVNFLGQSVTESEANLNVVNLLEKLVDQKIDIQHALNILQHIDKPILVVNTILEKNIDFSLIIQLAEIKQQEFVSIKEQYQKKSQNILSFIEALQSESKKIYDYLSGSHSSYYIKECQIKEVQLKEISLLYDQLTCSFNRLTLNSIVSLDIVKEILDKIKTYSDIISRITSNSKIAHLKNSFLGLISSLTKSFAAIEDTLSINKRISDLLNRLTSDPEVLTACQIKSDNQNFDYLVFLTEQLPLDKVVYLKLGISIEALRDVKNADLFKDEIYKEIIRILQATDEKHKKVKNNLLTIINGKKFDLVTNLFSFLKNQTQFTIKDLIILSEKNIDLETFTNFLKSFKEKLISLIKSYIKSSNERPDKYKLSFDKIESKLFELMGKLLNKYINSSQDREFSVFTQTEPALNLLPVLYKLFNPDIDHQLKQIKSSLEEQQQQLSQKLTDLKTLKTKINDEKKLLEQSIDPFDLINKDIWNLAHQKTSFIQDLPKKIDYNKLISPTSDEKKIIIDAAKKITEFDTAIACLRVTKRDYLKNDSEQIEKKGVRSLTELYASHKQSTAEIKQTRKIIQQLQINIKNLLDASTFYWLINFRSLLLELKKAVDQKKPEAVDQNKPEAIDQNKSEAVDQNKPKKLNKIQIFERAIVSFYVNTNATSEEQAKSEMPYSNTSRFFVTTESANHTKNLFNLIKAMCQEFSTTEALSFLDINIKQELRLLMLSFNNNKNNQAYRDFQDKMNSAQRETVIWEKIKESVRAHFKDYLNSYGEELDNHSDLIEQAKRNFFGQINNILFNPERQLINPAR